jgi:cytochrome c553
MNVSTLQRCWPLALALVWPAWSAEPTTPTQLLAAYTAQAGVPASPERGQKLFNTNFGRELGLSCASCHGASPHKSGLHALTEKKIAPLAPAANPARFTDRTAVELNFRINCKDVVGRECTAGEKADVLSWLLTLKP